MPVARDQIIVEKENIQILLLRPAQDGRCLLKFAEIAQNLITVILSGTFPHDDHIAFVVKFLPVETCNDLNIALND